MRTKALGFFFVAPGSLDSKGAPGWGIGGSDTMAFFRKDLKQEPWDILAEFQIYAGKGSSESLE